MKKRILIIGIILIIGFLLKDQYFTLSFYDTYVVVSYVYIAYLISFIVLVNIIYNKVKNTYTMD